MAQGGIRGRPLLLVPCPPGPMRLRPGSVGRFAGGLAVVSLSLAFSLSLSGIKFKRVTFSARKSFTGFPFLVARLRCSRRADTDVLQRMLPDLHSTERDSTRSTLTRRQRPGTAYGSSSP